MSEVDSSTHPSLQIVENSTTPIVVVAEKSTTTPAKSDVKEESYWILGHPFYPFYPLNPDYNRCRHCRRSFEEHVPSVKWNTKKHVLDLSAIVALDATGRTIKQAYEEAKAKFKAAQDKVKEAEVNFKEADKLFTDFSREYKKHICTIGKAMAAHVNEIVVSDETFSWITSAFCETNDANKK